MYDGKLVQRAASAGVVLQLTLVALAHYLPWVRIHAFEFAGMMFCGLAGLLYARDYARGYSRAALGGAMAGGTCGIIGLCAANILGDFPLRHLPVAAAILILIGVVGGLFGQLAADIRKLDA